MLHAGTTAHFDGSWPRKRQPPRAGRCSRCCRLRARHRCPQVVHCHKPLIFFSLDLLMTGAPHCTAQAMPLLGHMHPPFFKIMDEIQEGLRYVFQTRSKYTCLISGTGHAGAGPYTAIARWIPYRQGKRLSPHLICSPIPGQSQTYVERTLDSRAVSKAVHLA